MLDINSIFTEYDDSLVKSINTDPLGFQVVWTYFGQKIFHNKTTSIALDIRSYNINLFNQFIIYQILKNENGLSFDQLIPTQNNDTKFKIEKALVVLENLLTWSWFVTKDNDQWKEDEKRGLLGTSKALTIWKDNPSEYQINLTETNWKKIEILTNQRSLGVSGRYKGPFKAMKFFEEYTENSYKNSIVFEKVKPLIMAENSPFNHLYIEVMNFLKVYQNNKSYSVTQDNDLVDAFIITFKNPQYTASYTHVFWLEQLGLKDNEAKTLYEKVELNTGNKSEVQSVKDVFKKSYQDLNNSKIFQDIFQIEPQLTYLDILFEYVMQQHHDKKSIDDLDKKYLEPLKDFTWDNLDLQNHSSTKARIEKLAGIKDYQSLIKYHIEIMQKRERFPWVELKDDNTIKINVFQKIDTKKLEEQLSKKWNINEWVNDYYISSIRSIKQGLS